MVITETAAFYIYIIFLFRPWNYLEDDLKPLYLRWQILFGDYMKDPSVSCCCFASL